MGARDGREQDVDGKDDRVRPDEPEHVRRIHLRPVSIHRPQGKADACPLLHGRDPSRTRLPMLGAMEGGFSFPFGGDPEDLLRGLREFAEQQAESVQEAQREQFATLTLNTAVELTAAALSQLQASGSSDEQAIALRDAMRVLFPEAVALVSAARKGFMRES